MTAPEGSPAPTVVDSLGRLCPQPVVDLARAAKGRPAGEEVHVLADDPAAALDVPAWCRLRGHDYLGADELPDRGPRARAYRVRLR